MTDQSEFALMIKRFLTEEEDGATAIEYAFIAVMVTLGIVAALQRIGADVSGLLSSVLVGFNQN